MKMRWLVLVLLLLAATVACANAQIPLVAVNHTPANGLDVSRMAVFTFTSPLNPVEKDQIFVGHNATMLYIGAKVYDNNNIKDTEMTFYIYANGTTYKVVEHEGDTTAKLYTGSSYVLIPEHSTVSSTTDPFCEMIADVPLKDIGNSSTVLVYAQRNVTITHGMLTGAWNMTNLVQIGAKNLPIPKLPLKPPCVHRFFHKHHIFGFSYPPTASPTDTSTWLHVDLVNSLGNLTLTIHITKVTPYMVLGIWSDVGGEYEFTQIPITHTGNISLNVSTVTYYTIMLGGNLQNPPLPPTGFLITSIWGVNVSETNYTTPTLDIYSSTVDGYTINIVPEQPTALQIHVVNNTIEVNDAIASDLQIYAYATHSFVIMRAKYIAYNPLTEHWIFVLPASKVVYIKPTAANFAILTASNLMNMSLKGTMLKMVVGNGTIVIQNPVNKTINGTFAVVHNGIAMYRKIQYHDNDKGNITVINATEGNLTIYYKNPCKVNVSVNGTTITVYVKTPYTFNGVINVTEAGKHLISKNVTIAAPGGNYTISLSSLKTKGVTAMAAPNLVVTVYDLNSLRTIGSQSIGIKQLLHPLWIVIGIVIVIIVIGAIIHFVRKSKKAAIKEIERRGKYFRRI